MPINADKVEDITKKLKDMKFPNVKAAFGGKHKGWKITALVIVALIVLFFIVITPLAYFYTDVLWFNQLGFQSLFWKTFFAKIIMVVVFGLAFFFLLWGNLLVARKISPEEKLDLTGSPLEGVVDKARGVWSKAVRIGTLVLCIIAAIIAGAGWGGRWEQVLKFLNHSDFGVRDPVFGKDAGYYMFSYPFIRSFVDWLITCLIVVFIFVALAYLFQGGIRLKRGPEMLAPHVKAHLSVLLAVILLAKAWSYRLNMYELLFQKKGAVWGAGYTATHAEIPALWIMLILSILAAVVLLVNIKYKGWKLPAIAVGTMVVAGIIAGLIYPAIIQTYVVRPNERDREAPYLARNIAFTRSAYKINDIDVKPVDYRTDLTMADIQSNQATIRNIRLWDPRPSLDAFQQLQSIRQYYVFDDIDIDRYTIGGLFRQTMLSGRAMQQDNLPESARTWVNNTLVYTHGFGIVLAPTNDVVLPEGNPNFLLKDIEKPPQKFENLVVTQPRIYFAERQSNYVVVDTTEEEFDYPKTGKVTGKEKEAVTIKYKGDGGVKVNSIFRKLLFAVRFRDVNFFFSGQIKNDSQVMFFRSIADRLARCAPFLKMDSDPYMFIDDAGKPHWIVDCYTTSDFFPYSQPTQGMGNYIRNSVKADIDAYDGKVRLYVVDEKDPVIRTYMKIFPDIFTPGSKMPEDMKKHLRYPEDYYIAQANILRTYHMTNPNQFYNKEDEWEIPRESVQGGSLPMVPYYVIMKIPGMQGEEMVLMLPFTPHKKQNMIAWLAARMDPGHYGEMINFTYQPGQLISGPEQVEARIEQDPEISRQLSLWRQEGSQVIRGNLLVIPIENSILYVEPLYLQAVGETRIPQVRRVVVVYGQKIAMDETLEAALLRVFTGAPPTRPTTTTQPKPTTTAELAAKAADIYSKMLEAQKAGDWAAYGQYQKQLGEIIKQLGGK